MQINRDSGLDVIKVIACCFVVALHTINPDLGFINFAVFAVATIAIPCFFMINGYLMFQKETVTYAYVGKKIIRILFVCFLWEALHAIAYFIYYHRFRNILASFCLDFFQKGLFFHFWFMGTLMLLYLLLPVLRWLYERNAEAYTAILIGIGISCFFISMIMNVTKNLFVLEIPQSLRLWYWLFYYMLGGLINRRKEKIQFLERRCPLLIKKMTPILSVFLLVSWQLFIVIIVQKRYILETFYGSIPIMFAATIFFFSLSSMKFQRKKEITYLASLSMGIYIVHPFVLAVLQKFLPVFVNGNEIMNILFWIATLIVSGIISAIISLVPIVRELTRL